MQYTEELLKEYITRWGEVFVVLDSGEMYEVHGTERTEFSDRGNNTLVRVSGLRGDEYVIAEFDLDDIEHVYTHKEV